MKTTNLHPLGSFVRRFLLDEVVSNRNLSLNTQRSYRDTIRLLLEYIAQHHATDPDKVMTEQVSSTLVRDFLSYLEKQRKNSTATRNQRLAAIHSLFRFISSQAPELIEHVASISAIVPRRTNIPTMPYLDKQEMDALLAVTDCRRAQGRRDYALLLFLYNTGARASEAASLKINDLSLDSPLSVRLFGKGRKTRVCPLWPHTADILGQILSKRNDGSKCVFLNVRGQPVSRYGIHSLVARTVKKAALKVPSLLNKRVSPHTLRHTTAVHLLRAGVDINTIRAWLGHISLETTNRYAEVDIEMKAAALKACAIRDPEVSDAYRTPIWRKNLEIMEFLVRL